MHELTASFVLGYHGCDLSVAERLLHYEPFVKSENSYDWLGSGIYFWESNPDRAADWARETAKLKASVGENFSPTVIGAVIDLRFCLDLITSNGISAVAKAHEDLRSVLGAIGTKLPENSGGDDLRNRVLDCRVMNYLHTWRKEKELPEFDTVRALFAEGDPIFPGAGFREKTHIQLCVRNEFCIKAVFRVREEHFSSPVLS